MCSATAQVNGGAGAPDSFGGGGGGGSFGGGTGGVGNGTAGAGGNGTGGNGTQFGGGGAGVGGGGGGCCGGGNVGGSGSGSVVNFTNSGTVSGGNGDGGGGGGGAGVGGGGGDAFGGQAGGAAGFSIGDNTITNTNTGTITGGNGGNGGNGGAGIGRGGSASSGGAGGAGLDGITIVNAGTITGGNGGSGGTGIGGNGINGSNLTVIMNGGSLSGGFSGDGITRADAIAFTGGANTLTLNAGTLTGNISIVSGGNITFNEAGSYNLTNTITGAGSISHTGTGALTLSSANTYSGGTTISAGVLVAGHADTSGALNVIDALGTGTVTLDGGNLRSTVSASLTQNLTFNANKTSIVSAAAGQTLTLGGDTFGGNSGAVVFGANTVAQFGTATDTGVVEIGRSGGYTIAGTSRVVIGGGTLRDFQDQLTNIMSQVSAITLNAGATLDFNDSFSQTLVNLNGASGSRILTGSSNPNTLAIFTSGGGTNIFSGVISGAHPVSFNGSGTMILDGDNTYTGGTTVCFCTTLQLGNGGTTGSVVGDIVNENQLIFNRSNTYNFTGVISDTGDVLQNGTGNTVLAATHTYTGNTIVNAGTLSVNGDIRRSSGVFVNSGGMLGGTGFVPDTLIRAGGTLAPGNSIGTLNVIGNLQFITGSTYAIEVSPSAADRVNVTGTATLGGATVNATYAVGGYLTKQYTILNAGSITGRFSSLVNTNLPSSVGATLSYDTNNVYLNLELLFSVPSGLNSNQQNVGNALTNYFNSTGGIPLTFAAMTPAGLTQVSGEPGASIPTAGFAAMGQFINAMMDNAGSDGAQGGATGFAEENAYAPKRKLSPQHTDAYAAVTPRDRMPTFASRWNVWATGYGGNSTISGNSTTGSHDTSTRVFGTAVGADYRATPDTRFGFALGGAGTNFSVDSGLGGGRADVFQAGAYARHTMGAAYLAGALAYAWQDVATDRTVTVSGIDKLHAQMKANALSARLEGGWRTGMLPVAVTPYAALQSTAFYLPSYAETATSGSNQFALSYASKTVTTTRSELGARFDKAMPLNDAMLTLRARTAWAHDWNDNRSATATFQSLPGATFVVNGAQPSANAALLSVGGEFGWFNGWSVAVNFDGEFSRTTAGYSGKGSVKYAW